jgi:hypothetical protein
MATSFAQEMLQIAMITTLSPGVPFERNLRKFAAGLGHGYGFVAQSPPLARTADVSGGAPAMIYGPVAFPPLRPCHGPCV